MNFIRKLQVDLIHFKLNLMGDRVMDKEGCLKIPCKRCGKKFLSRLHYSGSRIVFDSYCARCDQ